MEDLDDQGEAYDTRGTGGESLTLRFRWRVIGDVGLDRDRKLVFPRAERDPGVYRLEVEGRRASVYFGEASDLRRRFGHYRNSGPSQQMNQRLNSLLVGALSNEGRCRVSVAEAVRLKTPSRAAGLDLRLKAARLLVESCAIVMARTDGTRAVLNLDAGYDRDLGGS